MHFGHAIGTIAQDFLIKTKQYQGYSTRFISGLDHAGIATHEKIIQQLPDKYSETEYFKTAEKYIDITSEKIIGQLKSLNTSLEEDFIYTLNKIHSDNVYRAYDKLLNDGLIYQDNNQTYINTKPLFEKLIGRLDEIEFHPLSSKNELLEYLKNPETWCISRQILWGHQIPNSNDRFDTWFSSSIYNLTCGGWNGGNYTKTDILESGRDLIFFWIGRMLFMGLYLTDELPFKKILLHGLIRDKHGRKFSKSLGNGIDPLDLITEHGIETFKLAILWNYSNSDLKITNIDFFKAKKIYKKYINAEKFLILQNTISNEHRGNWYNETQKIKMDFIKASNALEIRNAIEILCSFFKFKFCDEYIEDYKKDKTIEKYSDLYHSFNELKELFMIIGF